MRTKIKICGLRTPRDIVAANRLAAVDAAPESGGLAMLGFNFCPASPRYIEPLAAAQLAAKCAPSLARVALFVDASDNEIEEAVNCISPHYIQLHGSETPERCAEIKTKFSPGIIKALPVSSKQDLANSAAYEDFVDMFLFDARVESGGQFGGQGKKFDWELLRGFTANKQWILAGGLTPDNVAAAIAASGADFVDVASGVEREHAYKRQKDASLMAEFVSAVNDTAAARAA